jgi:hypothetical protein
MNVDWLNLHPGTVTHPGMWDDTFLRELLAGRHGPVPETGRVVVVPGRYHTADVDQINQTLRHSPTLTIITADEASELPADLLHPDTPVWCQTLRPGAYQRGVTPFPLGYPPDTRELISQQGFPPPDKDIWWWFSGQITHERRRQAADALQGLPGGEFHSTEGFTLGLPRPAYLERMNRARIIPCPSGPETQDTFRLWEALAAGAIPLADAATPSRNDGYWQALCPDAPFPIVEDWGKVRPLIEELAAGWPHTGNRVAAWWSRYRRQWAKRLTDTLVDLGSPPLDDAESKVTCVVPTSPIPSHPDTRFIEQTVESIRDQWPQVDIRIMVDGVRPEQWHQTGDYQEYTRRVLWLAEHQWWNVTVTVHDAHMHQAAMMAHELETISTPLILFVEHDTPLMGEWPRDQLVEAALLPEVDLLRLNHEHQIHPEHRHLLADDQTYTLAGLPAVKTRQWSQRPHLAKTARYREWLNDWFKPTERTMIEDRMHSVAQRFSWGRHRIWLYTPDGNQQRSWHSDARERDIKWPNN